MNRSRHQLSQEGTCTTPKGFRAAAAASGIKPDGLDLALVLSDLDAAAAGVFTQNRFAAAPVELDRTTLASNRSTMRAVIANAGNANACTGEQGVNDAEAMQRLAAARLEVTPNHVLVLSTGVIGVPLPMDRVTAGIDSLPGKLDPNAGREAARAIMTTDTAAKHASVRLDTDDGSVQLGGIAKGSGMIHPNMATMLAVLTTDAHVPPPFLQAALERAVDVSFNSISVDGDTSTNDTVLLLANGASGVAVEAPDAQRIFQDALTALCTDLAQKIVRDGEGATRFVQVRVTGLQSDADAKRIASTISTSPLVKTAFAGGDPNWGRILAAAGRAGVLFDPTVATLTVEGLERPVPVVLIRDGTPTGYAEQDAAAVFAKKALAIHLHLGPGPGAATMWTTDLTHDYVSINADYRS